MLLLNDPFSLFSTAVVNPRGIVGPSGGQLESVTQDEIHSSCVSCIVNSDQLSSNTYVRANLFSLCYNVSLFMACKWFIVC